jgi:hypothetical protein
MARYRPWTENDLARLRRMAGRYPAEQIAERLGRRLLDINLKAHELRISVRAPERETANMDPGAAGMDLKR